MLLESESYSIGPLEPPSNRSRTRFVVFTPFTNPSSFYFYVHHLLSLSHFLSVLLHMSNYLQNVCWVPFSLEIKTFYQRCHMVFRMPEYALEQIHRYLRHHVLPHFQSSYSPRIPCKCDLDWFLGLVIRVILDLYWMKK